MTSTPAFEATVLPRPVASGGRTPLALYALMGFAGLLAEQSFEKYLQLLTGATASASAVVLFAYCLGFALGGSAAATLLRKGRIGPPLRAYGIVELATGLACVAFPYGFHPLMAGLADVQNLFGAALRFEVRFFCGCLLILPAAALTGASFPLIAQALDSRPSTTRKGWSRSYPANLAGALAASLAAFPIFPSMGFRGALWICFAIGAAICALTFILPDAPYSPAPATARDRPRAAKNFRLLLAASFACGAILFALAVIWTHLIGAVLGATVYAFSCMLAAVSLGLLAGTVLVNRTAKAGFPAGISGLFQYAAVSLTVQFALWDRVPGLFRFIPAMPEGLKLCAAIALITPPAAILGLIYPRLLAGAQVDGEPSPYLASRLSAANTLGCLSGALLAIFVLVPVAGSEVSLKCLVLVSALFWILFLVREPLSRKASAIAAVVTVALLTVLLGKWWNWELLTAGHTPVRGSVAADGVRYLPASFVFKHEDLEGGFTTVVEQTIVSGEAAHTVRTLFTNGRFQGDDNPALEETAARFGFSAVPSLFVRDYGRALLIGLGTGYGAGALKHLGYREIAVAEFAPGIVRAAQECFGGLNEGILADPHAQFYLVDGRTMLLSDRGAQYDLITIEFADMRSAEAANLHSREFYELAHRRLRPGGVFQQWVQLRSMSPSEIASELAAAQSVFPYVGLWNYGGQGMLVASGHPLIAPQLQSQLQAEVTPGEAARLVESLIASRLLDPGGVARLVASRHPQIVTDDNRWIEYAAAQPGSGDWVARNLEFLRQYR
jgi:predicted membrane-bound spermidine synthase